MTHSVQIKSALVLAGFAFAVAGVLLAINLTLPAAIAALLFVGLVAAAVLLTLRREARARSTYNRNLMTRLEEVRREARATHATAATVRTAVEQLSGTVKQDAAGVASSLVALRTSVESNRRSVETVERLMKEAAARATKPGDVVPAAEKQPRAVGAIAQTQEAVAKASKPRPAVATTEKQPNAVGAIARASSLNAPSQSQGARRVLTIGRDLTETRFGELPSEAVLPGAIPPGATLPVQTLLVIDELGFARGAWKSFGGDFDEFLLAELNSVHRLVRERRVRVFTIRADEAPAHLSFTRSWGVTGDSVAEVVEAVIAAGTS